MKHVFVMDKYQRKNDMFKWDENTFCEKLNKIVTPTTIAKCPLAIKTYSMFCSFEQ